MRPTSQVEASMRSHLMRAQQLSMRSLRRKTISQMARPRSHVHQVSDAKKREHEAEEEHILIPVRDLDDGQGTAGDSVLRPPMSS